MFRVFFSLRADRSRCEWQKEKEDKRMENEEMKKQKLIE